MFGGLDFVSSAGITGGKIDGETLESRGEAEGKIAGDAAAMRGLMAGFNETVEVVVPDDALVEVV